MTFNGIVFDPSGEAFYVSGGPSDVIFVVTRGSDGTWGKPTTLPLGHKGQGLGLAVPADSPQAPINDRVGVVPCAAGVAISSDGQTLVVANYYNDSITVFTGGLGKWSMWRELDLRPGKSDRSQAGVAGGEYPFWVTVKGNGAKPRPLRVQYSGPRDRGSEAERLAGTLQSARATVGHGADPGEGPTQQDDAKRVPVTAVCGRGPVRHG